jgi:choline dehydrogenase-like flavoprotein
MPRTLLEWTVGELSEESSSHPFDSVVVGGGSAGLTAARTLAESGKRVALLEAGPASFLTNINNTELRFSRQLAENIRNRVQYGPKLTNGATFGPNFSCLGGRGLFWHGAAPRFLEQDFDGWPFTRKELEAGYSWAEAEFRVGVRLGETTLAKKIISQLRENGFAAEPGPFAADIDPIRPGYLSAGIASGLGIFFRGASQALSSDAIRIAVQATAHRILLSGNKARGVIASDRSEVKDAEIHASSVVLAGGGVESIRLAALSGVPDRSGRIGIGIQDHLFYRGFFEGKHLYGADPEAAVVYVPPVAQDSHQWELHVPGRRLFSLDDGVPWHPDETENYWLMIRSFAATQKRDANSVEVSPGGLGSATVHFEYSQLDEIRKTAMTQDAQGLSKGLDLTLKEERFAGPGGSYHEAGGLDMGTDPTRSVTNPMGAFHQIPNLVCVDAAAFPRIGATNPHLTIVAVSRHQSLALAHRLNAE